MRARILSAAVLSALVFLPVTQAFAQSIATYNLTVDNFWSQAHHEGWAQLFADVSSPHFSHLGGATHKSGLTIWEPGGLSSPGFIIMQEEGWIDKPAVGGDFKAEFDVHQANGDAEFFINYPEHFAAGSTTIRSFDISESHPLVTLFSMLGPTPDWFVGVNGLDLRDLGGSPTSTNGWLNSVVVDLFTYDGGSRTEDENFALFGALESPQRAIALIADTPVDTDPDRTALNSMQIGTFTFELQSVAIPEPTSLALCGLAALGMLGYGWRRRKNRTPH